MHLTIVHFSLFPTVTIQEVTVWGLLSCDECFTLCTPHTLTDASVKCVRQQRNWAWRL